MKKLKRTLLPLLIVFILLLPLFSVDAHPGRTASDGCHYCRTNCSYWGVPWNERHCHGGSYSLNQPKQETKPKIDYTTANSVDVEVISVVDGDTIKVKLPSGKIESVRFIGIDTPETKDPRKTVQCFGKEATQKMKELVGGKKVTLKRDLTNSNRDKYQRLLRYVYLDKTFINVEMIKQGYAYAYTTYPFQFSKPFKDYEKTAKESEKGLWSPKSCNGKR